MNYDGAALCGHRSGPAALGANYRWPHRKITWAITADLPTLPREAFARAAATALARLAAVCGLTFEQILPTGGPNLAIGIQTEAPGGVLADCQLPYPGIQPTASLRCRVDTADAWVIADNPPTNRVDLVRVLCHEFGHGLGLDHGPAGALMAPTYSTKVKEPQAWDIVELQARYGPATAPPPPPPPPPDPQGLTQLLAFFRQGGRLFVRTTTGQEIDL